MNVVASLSLKLFYPHAISASEIDDYNEAFAFWNEVWVETRREVDPRLATPSDSFTRQSEILVLYHEGRPIATCCHRYVDLRHASVLSDSYFSGDIWPDDVKARVPGLGQSCVLGSHIFIDPAFRKSRSGLPIKEIVCALCFAHVNGTRPDVLLGMTRIDRGLNTLFREAGAISLCGETRWYQIPVDLIALFPKKHPIAIPPEHRDAVHSIARTCPRFGADYLERTRAKRGFLVDSTKEASSC